MQKDKAGKVLVNTGDLYYNLSIHNVRKLSQGRSPELRGRCRPDHRPSGIKQEGLNNEGLAHF